MESRRRNLRRQSDGTPPSKRSIDRFHELRRLHCQNRENMPPNSHARIKRHQYNGKSRQEPSKLPDTGQLLATNCADLSKGHWLLHPKQPKGCTLPVFVALQQRCVQTRWMIQKHSLGYCLKCGKCRFFFPYCDRTESRRNDQSHGSCLEASWKRRIDLWRCRSKASQGHVIDAPMVLLPHSAGVTISFGIFPRRRPTHIFCAKPVSSSRIA